MTDFESYQWADFAQHDPPPVHCLVPGFLPGTLGLLTAPTNTGKTWAALYLAISVATGIGLNPDWPVDVSGPVTYVNAEDPPPIIHHRVRQLASASPLQRMDASVRFLFPRHRDMRLVILDRGNRPVLDPRVQQRLEQIADHQSLLILDPLNKFYAVDENSNFHMNSVIDALSVIAHRANCAILLVHHEGKKGDSRGASAITAGVQWHGELRASRSTKQPGGRLTIVKSRWGDVPPLSLIWGQWVKEGDSSPTPPTAVAASDRLITPDEYFQRRGG